ncbi:MAG: YoaK family protein [Verrucomicrobiae bacterium]|nr:YoaK family protein [Verrucomicrobiae bacterium]
MTSRRIVVAGGCALAFGAALANTGLVIRTGTSVSHLTGDTAKLTISLARWSPAILPEIYRVAAAASCFFLGATSAGVLIHHPLLDVSRPYGRTITGIGVLFLLSSVFVVHKPVLAIGLASFGCGIQNALASHYRGIVLRTTHVTGMFTDFGITLGMHLRGHDVPGWKIAVPALLIGSFFLGGISGALAHYAGYDVIVVAGVSYCLAGIGWSVAKHLFPGDRL